MRLLSFNKAITTSSALTNSNPAVIKGKFDSKEGLGISRSVT